MELKNYSLNITTTESLLCQAPNGYHLSIVGGFLTETASGTATVNLNVYDNSDTLKITIPFVLSADQRIDISTKMFLNQNEYIKVAITSGTASIVLFGAETVKDTSNIPDDWSWLGTWNGAVNYALNNVVEQNGTTYICTTTNTNSEPPSANWSIFAGGIACITKTAGDGSAGTTDTYTLWRDDAATIAIDTFDVYNGADGINGGLQNIIEDTTPQLGGTLDCNGKALSTSSYTQIADASLGTGTHTFDFSAGDMQQLTATGDITLAFSNFVTGKVCSFIIDAVNWGDHTITHPTGLVFAAGTAPTYTSGGTDRLMVIKDKDDVFSLFVVGQAIAEVA